MHAVRNALKEKLAKAKAAKQRAESRKYESQLEDLKADLKRTEQLRTASNAQLKKDQQDLISLRQEKEEFEQYKDYLEGGEEEFLASMAQYEAEAKQAEDRLEATRQQCLTLDGQIGSIEGNIQRIEAQIGIESPRKTSTETEEPKSHAENHYVDRGTLEVAQKCRDEVQKHLKDIKELTEKLPAYSNDDRAMYLLIKIAGAKCRILMGKDNEAEEETILRRCLGILRRLCGEYRIRDHIESLAPGKQNWPSYLQFSLGQLTDHLNGRTSSPRYETTQRLKLPESLGPAAAPPMPKPLPKPRPQPVAKKPEPKPVPKPAPKAPVVASAKKPILADDKLRALTRGKKAAVLGGAAEHNEPMRRWLEKEFEFRDLRWYDRNTDSLLQSFKAGALEVLLVFKQWHRGYSQYTKDAKAYGVKVVLLDNSNKKLICDSVSKAFDYTDNLFIPA